MIAPLAPPPASKRLAVRITPIAERPLRRGHPWLFDGGITNLEELADGRAGDLAVVFDQKRRFLAIGLYDPHSPIRVKVLHHKQPTRIDNEWFLEKVREAAGRRASLDPQQTTGYRLIYGEGDGLPGLIVDVYADTLVVKVYSAIWFPYLHVILNEALALTAARRVVVRLARTLQQRPDLCWGIVDGGMLWGDAPADPVPYLENGLVFTADVLRGHKTGTFFDHRDNRLWVKNAARGRHVLDVFCYSGGFAVHAAVGGAHSITAVDVSRPALKAAAENLRLNGCSDVPFEPLVGDAFDLLAQLATQGREFDLLILDPPSFAKQKSEIPAAVRAYRQLTHLALNLLSPGGILVFASCSSRVSAELFYQTVMDAAEEAGRPLWVHRQVGHALDHPVRPTFPEGAYLKCLFASPID